MSSIPVGSPSSGLENFAVHLIREGQWREAVYLVREETGVSVAQAEHAVERMALKHGLQRFSRTFFVAIIALCGLTTIVLAGLVEILS